MNSRHPPMTALPVFAAVGRHLSVARAAQELNLTPGAVSRQIRNLEDHVGCLLFERGHRRITFTDEGRAYWTAINTALSDIRSATDTLGQSSGNRALIIACPRVFLQSCLIPVLGSFFANHPEVQVTLQVDGPNVDGVDGRIFVGREPAANLVVDKLIEGDLILVCSPGYKLRSPPLDRPEDLAHHVLLRSAEFRRNWDRWLDRNLSCLKPGCRFMDFDGAGFELPAAVEGLGIAIVRTPLVRQELATGRLVTLFDDCRIADSYRFEFHERRLRQPGLRRFRSWLRQTFQCRVDLTARQTVSAAGDRTGLESPEGR
ncbi:LysR substrate-binding domain-containing protein [Paracoccus sp. MBLB3053]|uniref:LysR substrate-binding domain-containing protein n=1 Tax=Paracoccus aurantius TaxID=3073814 RepID=A0ABU2HS81_9RHOB|nr:LysR substrate-binding domain-containing protein [Paracoccus sp. MBLB3053]MDS9467913.1 LysR substrate-binding domain-containing protein [Paracoccus sp. MBLB3053]